MYCPRCGNYVREGVAFCPKCGHEFSASTHPTAPYEMVQDEPLPTSQPLSLDSFSILRLVIGVLLVVCMFLPWYRIGVDSVIDATNSALSSYGETDAEIPRMGGFGLSIVGIGDALGSVTRLSNWLKRAGESAELLFETEEMVNLESIAVVSFFYRVFEFIWAAGIVTFVAGASMNIFAKQNASIAKLGSLLCAAAAIIGIVVALFAASRIDSALAEVVSAELGSDLMPLGPNGFFKAALAPYGALACSCLSFVLTHLANRRD